MIARRQSVSKRASLLMFLLDPASYPDRTTAVEVVETHISWVFLIERFVYKLKKPVRFEFLDFHTATLRRKACEQEVQLNRRLSPDVYLGVVPIVETQNGYQIGGPGRAVDWLVKMRRLPGERAMDVLIREGNLSLKQVDTVADTLSRFYRRLPPLSVTSESYVHDLEQHVLGNHQVLSQPDHGLDLLQLRRVYTGQLRAIRLAPEMFHDRVRDGRIVDGHGDLRPEHIYLADRTQIIDCVEFNPEFRRLDVLDELAFLSMECSFHGAPEAGGRILQRYCQTCADAPPAELLTFYLCYRACVRAKVQALRAQQHDEPAQRDRQREIAARYLSLADHSASALGARFVLIVRGLSGTGKSTLARALSHSLGLDHLQTDAIRRELFGESPADLGFGQGIYSDENRMVVYDAMLDQTRHLLDCGLSVILDGTFLSTLLRARVALMARHYGVVPLVIHCRCPREVARARISSRMLDAAALSAANPQTQELQHQLEEHDPPGLDRCMVDSSDSLPMMLQSVYRALAPLVFPRAVHDAAQADVSTHQEFTGR